MDKYELEFSFIPSLVDAMNESKIPPQALIDIRWWEEVLGKMGNKNYGFDFAEIKAEARILQSGTKAILYTFPEADRCPLAKYGIILFNEQGNGTYYTFEAGMSHDQWFIGSKRDDTHINFGESADCPTADSFASLIEERILGVKTIKPKDTEEKREGFFGRLFK